MSADHTWLREEGMTIREVARALHITPARVQQLEAQALKKLRRYPGLLFEFVRGSFEPVYQPRARRRRRPMGGQR